MTSARDVIAEQRLRQFSIEFDNSFDLPPFHGEADTIQQFLAYEIWEAMLTAAKEPTP